MKKVFNVISFGLIALLMVGCSDRKNVSPMPSISKEASAELREPVNCATAKQDIALLESERASVAKQILSGVRAVMPIAAVAGVLMGDYSDRAKVATGQYNRDIEVKIEEIKSTCNLA